MADAEYYEMSKVVWKSAYDMGWTLVESTDERTVWRDKGGMLHVHKGMAVPVIATMEEAFVRPI